MMVISDNCELVKLSSKSSGRSPRTRPWSWKHFKNKTGSDGSTTPYPEDIRVMSESTPRNALGIPSRL